MPEHRAAWTPANGDTCAGAGVAMPSGRDDEPDPPAFRRADADGPLPVPGVHPEAMAKLPETPTGALRADALPLDLRAPQGFATRHAFSPSGRRGIEGLAGRDRLPATGATLIAAAPGEIVDMVHRTREQIGGHGRNGSGPRGDGG